MAEAAPPTRAALFLGYAKIGLLGFGGVAAIARHVIVEERRWLSERDYAEVLAVGQILPGPNVGNAAVMIGRRFHGLAGALVATSGLYIGPLAVLLLLATAYEAFATLPAVRAAMHGVAAAAAGLVLGMALKMGTKLKPPPELLAVGVLSLLAGWLLRLPLPVIVLALGPLGVWLSLRRAGAARA